MSRPGTATSAWVAGVGTDAETIYPGGTEDVAIGEAMATYAERICGQYGHEMEPVVEVEVYQGATWCTGPETEEEDCVCGGGHEEGRWLLFGWERRHVTEVATAPWVVDP